MWGTRPGAAPADGQETTRRNPSSIHLKRFVKRDHTDDLVGQTRGHIDEKPMLFHRVTDVTPRFPVLPAVAEPLA